MKQRGLAVLVVVVLLVAAQGFECSSFENCWACSARQECGWCGSKTICQPLDNSTNCPFTLWNGTVRRRWRCFSFWLSLACPSAVVL